MPAPGPAALIQAALPVLRIVQVPASAAAGGTADSPSDCPVCRGRSAGKPSNHPRNYIQELGCAGETNIDAAVACCP